MANQRPRSMDFTCEKNTNATPKWMRRKRKEYTASFEDEAGNIKTLSLNKSDARKLGAAKTEEERAQWLRQMSRKLEYRICKNEGGTNDRDISR